MRLSSVASLCVLLAACVGDSGKNGSSCTVQSARDGSAVIMCDDGSRAVVAHSADAGSCSVHDQGGGTKTIVCSDGTTVSLRDGDAGVPGAQGMPGKQGPAGGDGVQGSPGPAGQDGQDGTNGTNGQNGADGTSQSVAGPGLVIDVTSVSIPSDRKPVARLQLHDAAGHPLDRQGLYTQGAVELALALAYLPANGEPYAPYDLTTVTGQTIAGVPPLLASAQQAQADQGGSFTTIDAARGIYDYQFGYALPSGYDATKTHTVIAYGARSADGQRYVGNAVFHFRPDAQAVTDVREVVSASACNGCHGRLSAHDDRVREVSACVVCHVPGTADPESGRSLDFRRMVHAIHRGAVLPTQGYRVVGDGGVVADFGTVLLPKPNERCDTCHGGAAQGGRHQTALSREVCGSCHDDVFFGKLADLPTGMKPHSGNEQDSDTLCFACHEAGAPPYPSGVVTAIDKVHRPVRELPVQSPSQPSTQVLPPAVVGDIVSVTSMSQGSDQPVVTFTLGVDGASVASIAEIDHVRLTFAGPTSDYVSFAQFTVAGNGAEGTLAPTGNPGEFRWTSAATLQEIANGPTLRSPARPAIPLSGSWAVGLEASVVRSAVKPDTTVIPAVTYSCANVVRYVSVDGGVPTPRRQSVDRNQCMTCHADFEVHGGERNDPELCVTCHGATEDSSAVPLPPAGKTALSASLRASSLLHRIHTGAAGARGFSLSGKDYGALRYPDDRRRCGHCHVANQPSLPLPSGLLASVRQTLDSAGQRQRGGETYIGATAAACTGCHDDDSTAVHVKTMSVVSTTDPADIDEACATCHAAGESFGIDVVHSFP